jgi:hypothetical protein
VKERISEKHHIDGVFVLLLFCVFAACVLLVLLTGAGSYQRLTARDEESYDRRVCVQYIAARVRHADQAQSVYVGDFDGNRSDSGDTLHLLEEIDGEQYDTRIYCYDGYVRELFASSDGDFAPEDGDTVLPAQSLSFSCDPSTELLTVHTANAAGQESSLSLALRSGEGAAS